MIWQSEELFRLFSLYRSNICHTSISGLIWRNDPEPIDVKKVFLRFFILVTFLTFFNVF